MDCFINNCFHLRVLVELAQLQDDEVGDGTTSVVILAAELLKVINIYSLNTSLKDNLNANDTTLQYSVNE